MTTRPYKELHQELLADRDGLGRRSQTRMLVTCPFCGEGVPVYVWSFYGRGKRCPCGALLTYVDAEKEEKHGPPQAP